MNITEITIESMQRSVNEGRGTIKLDCEEFPIKWTYTHTSRHKRSHGVDEALTAPRPVAMLRTNPPKLKKRIGRENYVQVFNEISDAVWEAAYAASESSRDYVPVDTHTCSMEADDFPL
jgi:hypothetical protein